MNKSRKEAAVITPCGVLYKEISEAARMKRYEEIDARILSRTFSDEKGRTPFDRVARAGSYRTREIIQKDPRELDVRIFRDAHLASMDLISFLKQQGQSNSDIFDQFSGDSSEILADSLRFFLFDYHLFLNCMNSISYNGNPNDLSCIEAIMLLFVLTAFHGDPRSSVPRFFKAAQASALSVNVETGLVTDSIMESVMESYPAYGLIRCYPDGKAATRVYPLNTSEQGTVIGRLTTSAHSINDVGNTVSREHLLIFRKDATWYARGLRSTNGSMIVREDGTVEIIEPPSTPQAPDAPIRNVPLQQGDLIRLGYDTSFRVVPLGAPSTGSLA